MNYWNETYRPGILAYFQQVNRRIGNVLNDLPELSLKEVPSTYIYGTVGSGKSVYAARLLMEYHRIQVENKRNHRSYLFIPVVELLNTVKSNFNNKTSDYLNKFKFVDLLVLDDIGVQYTTNWVLEALYELISYRYNNLKTTIYTAEFSLENLSKIIPEDRIISRIAHDCHTNIIEFNRDSYRC